MSGVARSISRLVSLGFWADPIAEGSRQEEFEEKETSASRHIYNSFNFAATVSTYE
jgi:hypothetical protein